MRGILLLVGVLLASTVLGVRPSQAQVGDCSDAYVRSFDAPARDGAPAWSAGRIQCRDYFHVEVSTPRGYVMVRGIGDEHVADLLPVGAVRAVERGVQRVRNRVGELGDFELYNTTILIASRPRANASEFRPEAGYVAARRDRTGAECRVSLFIEPDFTPEEIQYAVAHELFHCIQQAVGTLSPAQNASVAGFGKWWIEGSAEWFATWIVGPQTRWPRARQFESAVADGEALYDMSYRAAVFFYWFDETQGGPHAIVPFLRVMAESGDAAAQQAAMRGVLAPAQWLAFVKAYDDREIHYPGGGMVGFGRRVEGVAWRINDTGDQLRSLAPFVIAVGWADYGCGLWANTAADVNVEVRAAELNVWTAWPDEIDTRAAVGRHRVVGIAVEPGESVEFRLSAVRREGCGVELAGETPPR